MSIISTATVNDVRFVAVHESPGGRAVTRAYRCPAGVITIGHGFTMGSRVFAAYWRTKHGRGLQMGDTITQAEADMLLRRLLDEEYGAAVAAKVKPRQQHHFGAAASMTFNCGPGALGWRWAQSLAQGAIAESARLLRTTATTANGRRLAGLVRRRAEEARLLETGQYTTQGPAGQPVAVSQTRTEIREYQQQLATLGYAVGPIDGIAGAKTTAAVRKFQADQKLTVDGIVGPATRAALVRALDARAGNRTTGTAGASGGAGAGGSDFALAPDPSVVDALLTAVLWGVGVAAVLFIAFIIWRYRGVFTGQRQPT